MSEGVKYDHGKLRHDLVNPAVINALAKFYMKKSFWNFLGVIAAFASPRPDMRDKIIRLDSLSMLASAPRPDLVPAEGMSEVAKVYGIGAMKYGDRNWELGMAWGRVFAAMMRHSWAWWCGQKRDPVDGQHHLASVAWCAMALITFEKRGVGTDDRQLP